MELPIELYQEILEQTNFLCQIRLMQINKYLYENLKIYDFLNIESNYLRILTNSILKNYKYITKLNVYQRITNDGIKHLKLHTLDASQYVCKITDDGISHMNLHILN